MKNIDRNKISIIVPVYNVELYIERFINSVLSQTVNTGFEVLLVDDCGNDQSIAIAERMLKNSATVFRIIKRASNGGLSAARNSGIEAAQGDFIYFADSDDVLENNAVEIFLNAIEKAPNAKMLLFNAHFKNINEKELKYWRGGGLLPNIISSNNFLEYLYKGTVGAYIWQFLFDKSIFEKLRFKEGAVWEDAIFVPQAASLVDTVVSDDQAFIYQYLLRPGSISQSIHPQIDQVVAGLNEVEARLYPVGDEKLYPQFVEFRTSILMRLSRECFTRSNNYRELMAIHSAWAVNIPNKNVRVLWQSGKKKSAVFLWLTKNAASFIYFLYVLKVLK